jgi:hypothetical protein
MMWYFCPYNQTFRLLFQILYSYDKHIRLIGFLLQGETVALESVKRANQAGSHFADWDSGSFSRKLLSRSACVGI